MKDNTASIEEQSSDQSHEHETKYTGDQGTRVITEEARIATAKEHGLTVRQGLKAYPKAIMWSILLSSAVIMEGYDTILVSMRPDDLISRLDCETDDVGGLQIGSYLGFTSFNNTFGNQVGTDGSLSITAPWQSAGKFRIVLNKTTSLSANNLLYG